MFQQLYNGQIQATTNLIEPSNPLCTVYEVLRVVNGIPLFFHDHFLRLLKSVKLVGRTIELDSDIFFYKLIQLCQLNDVETGNIMLKIFFFEENYIISGYFIPYNYPEPEQYQKGVEVGLLEAERLNPEAKVENHFVRDQANQSIHKTGVYEVLLVNNKEEVTEGSRSNFLAVKDNCIYTAPLSEILQGITLNKTIQIARANGITVYFKSISVDSINSFEALFLTGTSPKILPIYKLGDFTFNVDHPVIKTLIDEYEKLIVLDIAKKRDSFQNPR